VLIKEMSCAKGHEFRANSREMKLGNIRPARPGSDRANGLVLNSG
jgi:hypothetical protein